MTHFDVSKKVDASGIIVLKLEGLLDADTVHSWESVLDEVLKEKGPKLLVDLSDLEYISSAGIGTFIGCIGEVRKNGGNIVFFNTSPRVLKVFKLLGFTKLFEVTEEKDEAIKALTGG